MIWLGLTGPMACGKSTVARYLSETSGVSIIDADQLARSTLAEGSPIIAQIVERWGAGVLSLDGKTLDRKKVGEKVFNQPEERKWLEARVHPLVQDLAKKKKQEAMDRGDWLSAYDVPLLFENSLQEQFDLVLLVACDMETQIGRSTKRDGLSEVEVRARIQSQMPLSEKLKKADYIIWNSAKVLEPELRFEVDKFVQWVRGINYRPR